MIGILLVWFCAVCFSEINDWVSYHLWWFAIPLFLLRAAQRRTRSEKGEKGRKRGRYPLVNHVTL
jgi:hypothetical protein